MYNRWVIMNTMEKLNLQEIIEWWGSEGTIIHCRRQSNRGKVEDIYIVGAYGNYITTPDMTCDYITDTGNGYGGRGKVQVLNYLHVKNGIIVEVKYPDKINEITRIPLWVFK